MSVTRHTGQLFHTPEDDDQAKQYSCAVNAVKEQFPTAIVSTDVLDKVNALLHIKKADKSFFYAQSVCSDELNFERKDITRLFSDHIGEVFQLGGLAGIPFTGKTGFAAYSGHIPDVPKDANLFILFAPHIGVSNDGILGKVNRKGKTCADSACGAACGALQHCLDCQPIPVPGKVFGDYQMDFIKTQVHKHLDKITCHADPQARQAALAVTMYNVAKECMVHTIHFNKPTTPTVYILGGIQVNMPHSTHGEDLFVPLMFTKRDPHGAVTDLFGEVFGTDAENVAKLHNWPKEECEEKGSLLHALGVVVGGAFVAGSLYALNTYCCK